MPWGAGILFIVDKKKPYNWIYSCYKALLKLSYYLIDLHISLYQLGFNHHYSFG